MDVDIQTKIDEAVSKLKIVFMDFDGIFTDDKVNVDEDGKESVKCYRGDGIGIENLEEIGIESYILSSETNLIVKQRADKFGIEFGYGISDKLEMLKRICKEKDIDLSECGFLGNDINDVEAMEAVGLSMAPPDCYASRFAMLLGRKKGGEGIVREICDYIYLKRTAKKEGE